MQKKTVLFYLLIISVFGIYLWKADYIFNVLIKTSHQSEKVKTRLPEQSNDLRFDLEEVKLMSQKWKSVLYVRGWVAIPKEQVNSIDVRLVLAGENSVKTFKAHHETIITRILHVPVEVDDNIEIMGFEFYIPTYWLNKSSYSPGLVLYSSSKYAMSENIVLTLGGDELSLRNEN